MPFEENPYIVPHFKALISCQKYWGVQRCGSTLSLRDALVKISILLHKMASDWFILSTAVCNKMAKATRVKLKKDLSIPQRALNNNVLLVKSITLPVNTQQIQFAGYFTEWVPGSKLGTLIAQILILRNFFFVFWRGFQSFILAFPPPKPLQPS